MRAGPYLLAELHANFAGNVDEIVLRDLVIVGLVEILEQASQQRFMLDGGIENDSRSTVPLPAVSPLV